MKNGIILITIAFGMFIIFQAFQVDPVPDAEFPDDINKILVSSCYDCHTTDGNSEDAVKALDFILWDQYRTTKKIGLLGDIGKILEEGKMPPKKYLEFKPDRKLSDSQKKLIVDWTKEESEKLMEGNE